MELLYLWVRDYKNIKNKGFNLSGKVTFEAIIEKEDSDGNIFISLNATENKVLANFFPENVLDVKAVIGENGAGKTNFIFSLLEILLDKKNRLNGFLVTTDGIIVRDKITLVKTPSNLFNKPIQIIYPEDIKNFGNTKYSKFFSREEVFNSFGPNIMETYFENASVIFYSPFLNTDNIHNVDGIENDYARWENEKPNFLNISTESIIITDYYSLNNNDNYLITGESELLAYKYEESKRMLAFLKTAEEFNFEIKFPVHSIGIEFTNFGDKFWKSIDKIISRNSHYEYVFESVFKFSTKPAKDRIEEFFNELSKSITYCFLSFELKVYFNFSNENQIPIARLADNLQSNYNAELDNFEALYDYIRKTEIYGGNKEKIIQQIKDVKNYFTDRFSKDEIICDGMHGFLVLEKDINTILEDFLKPPLTTISINEEEVIVLNIFGFKFNGLSSGERSFLSLFSRINFYYKTRIKKNTSILLIIDEGEIGLHPQWQKKYLKILLDFIEKFFPDNTVQLLINTHSPFIASDLPKENIIFLKKNGQNMASLGEDNKHTLTFGANIHNLLANDFFLQDGFIGDFAKNKIAITLNWLKIKANEFNKLKKITNSDFVIDPKIKVLEFANNEQELSYHRQIIEMIGEPLVKNKLKNIFIEYVDVDSALLENELEQAKNRVRELEKRLER